MIERRPLVDGCRGRKVDVGLETGAVAGERCQGLGGNVVRGRLERVQPRKVLAPEELDGRQIRKQEALRLMRVHTPLAQEQVATGIVALLIRAGVPLADWGEFLLEKDFQCPG